jgi:cysteine-rich repeat protein
MSESTSYSMVAGCAAVLQNTCGNSVLEANEECDDGNTANGDCCSSTCQFESSSTVCRPSMFDCDAAETCTGSSATCPADIVSPAGTSCTADANACTRDRCDGTSTTCMHNPDTTLPGCEPMVTPGGATPGSGTVGGMSNPGCTGGAITIFDCGPNRTCFDNDDTAIGSGVKDVNGKFQIAVPALACAQLIYISDSCTTPPLLSDPILISCGAAPAPLLSPLGIALAMLLLLGIAALAMRRLRESE